MAGPNFTRRDALRFGAGAVAVSALRVSPASAAAASFSLALPDGGAHASSAWHTTPVLHAPRRFDLVGLTWKSGKVEAQVRARPRGGRWSAWFALPAGVHAADGAPAPTPEQEVRRLYEEAESRVAKAAERVVARDSFGEILAMVTENAVAVTRIGNEAMDLVLRNLRVASRQDINRLTRALGRTEDKLEQVLQEVERLRDDLDADASSNGSGTRRASGSGSASGSRSGSGSGSASGSRSGSGGTTRRRTTRRSSSS